MGSTIQQGVIQCLVHQETQSWTTVNTNPVQPPMMSQTRVTSTQVHSNGNVASDPEGNGRDILPEHDSTDYVMNCIHKSRPLSLNDIGRPIFVNHYYAGESVIPVTSKKLIKLDECDKSTEDPSRNHQMNMQPQGLNWESVEASQDLLRMPLTTTTSIGPILPEKD